MNNKEEEDQQTMTISSSSSSNDHHNHSRLFHSIINNQFIRNNIFEHVRKIHIQLKLERRKECHMYCLYDLIRFNRVDLFIKHYPIDQVIKSIPLLQTNLQQGEYQSMLDKKLSSLIVFAIKMNQFRVLEYLIKLIDNNQPEIDNDDNLKYDISATMLTSEFKPSLETAKVLLSSRRLKYGANLLHQVTVTCVFANDPQLVGRAIEMYKLSNHFTATGQNTEPYRINMQDDMERAMEIIDIINEEGLIKNLCWDDISSDSPLHLNHDMLQLYLKKKYILNDQYHQQNNSSNGFWSVYSMKKNGVQPRLFDACIVEYADLDTLRSLSYQPTEGRERDMVAIGASNLDFLYYMQNDLGAKAVMSATLGTAVNQPLSRSLIDCTIYILQLLEKQEDNGQRFKYVPGNGLLRQPQPRPLTMEDAIYFKGSGGGQHWHKLRGDCLALAIKQRDYELVDFVAKDASRQSLSKALETALSTNDRQSIEIILNKFNELKTTTSSSASMMSLSISATSLIRATEDNQDYLFSHIGTSSLKLMVAGEYQEVFPLATIELMSRHGHLEGFLESEIHIAHYLLYCSQENIPLFKTIFQHIVERHQQEGDQIIGHSPDFDSLGDYEPVFKKETKYVLQDAAKSGRFEIAQFLMAANPTLRPTEETIVLAVTNNHLDILSLLINSHASFRVNSQLFAKVMAHSLLVSDDMFKMLMDEFKRLYTDMMSPTAVILEKAIQNLPLDFDQLCFALDRLVAAHSNLFHNPTDRRTYIQPPRNMFSGNTIQSYNMIPLATYFYLAKDSNLMSHLTLDNGYDFNDFYFFK
ncbi:hypothetical protein DFA_10299 [Cavenderia fasciculata]|uniref:Ankyrin repeat-containing protein n=1 Tax=Cavenderia fasciculata TaxID=261658 RepID=F4Q9U1_CACFS|nr:uncharacterized protein DFA_10299 [Cavenderia fasciculata]EGG15460.1 hypothetical protein DFA_10299 [Cavenderia fasciculata]|eukprot:XP_004354202.1 hypothetical protein DFA_10299 [Cavenderia fasciculata]